MDVMRGCYPIEAVRRITRAKSTASPSIPKPIQITIAVGTPSELPIKRAASEAPANPSVVATDSQASTFFILSHPSYETCGADRTGRLMNRSPSKGNSI